MMYVVAIIAIMATISVISAPVIVISASMFFPLLVKHAPAFSTLLVPAELIRVSTARWGCMQGYRMQMREVL
jgi:hypothetical protein